MKKEHPFDSVGGETNYLLQSVFENLSVGLELYDKNGILIDVNRTEMKSMGIKDKKDVLGRSFFDNPNVSDDLKKHIREGNSVQCVIEYDFDKAKQFFPTVLSTVKYFDVSASPLCNEEGEVICYLVVTQDITDRILWQRKYETLYNQNMTILESLPVGVELYNTEGHMLYMNNADCSIFGVDQNLPEIKDINIFKNPVLPEEVKDAVRNKTKILTSFPYDFSKVKTAGYHNNNRNGDDVVRQIQCNGTPVFNANGELENYVFIVNDVTEAVQAEKELLENKKKTEIAMEALSKKNAEIEKKKKLQETILNSIPLPIHIKEVEDNFRYVFCNEESKRMFGITEHCTVYDVMSRERADKMQTTDLEVYATGKPYFGRERILLKDGREYETIVQKQIIEDDGKRLLLNIRWDKGLQNELERRAKTLSLSLNALNAYTWYYDIENDRLTYGDGFEKIGRDPESINTAEKFIACIHPDYQEYVWSVFRELTTGEEREYSFEYRIDINGDGNYVWWERRGTVETVVEDDISRKFLFGMDINIEAHKKTERVLLDKEEEMKQLIRQNELVLNNINSGLAYISTNYVVQWENVSICSTSLSYEAYKRGEVCYKSAHNRTTPCEDCVMQRAFKSRQVEQIQFHLHNERFVEVFASPVINERNEIEGVVIRVDDITERQQMIIELEKAKHQAEESDKLKSAFLANMSHEIRTPLNAIVGFSDLLMNAGEMEEKEEYMRIINANNDLLLKLINDILDLSKIEAGSVDLKYEEFDLADYFKELYSSMQRRVASKSNVRLLVANPYECCMVRLDKNRLAQIITNYVTNAIKYTPKGFIEMGYEEVDEGIRLYVRDTGIGIPEEKKCKVFHRFEKLDEFAQGTGLGLSICRAIVEACNGEVGFESQYGEGSLFWAILPCDVEVRETKNSPVQPEVKAGMVDKGNPATSVVHEGEEQKVILVAEDIQSNFLLVSALLKKKYKLIHALNGKEAVDIVRTQPVDLVLMDMKMPVMDGLTATAEIRKINAHIPIVALTAHAFESDKVAALEAGCNNYLVKPVNRVKLMQMLREYFN